VSLYQKPWAPALSFEDLGPLKKVESGPIVNDGSYSAGRIAAPLFVEIDPFEEFRPRCRGTTMGHHDDLCREGRVLTGPGEGEDHCMSLRKEVAMHEETR